MLPILMPSNTTDQGYGRSTTSRVRDTSYSTSDDTNRFIDPQSTSQSISVQHESGGGRCKLVTDSKPGSKQAWLLITNQPVTESTARSLTQEAGSGVLHITEEC